MSGGPKILPMDFLSKCRESMVRLVMKDGREFYGKLKGFDESLNVVLSEGVEGSKEIGSVMVVGSDI